MTTQIDAVSNGHYVIGERHRSVIERNRKEFVQRRCTMILPELLGAHAAPRQWLITPKLPTIVMVAIEGSQRGYLYNTPDINNIQQHHNISRSEYHNIQLRGNRSTKKSEATPQRHILVSQHGEHHSSRTV